MNVRLPAPLAYFSQENEAELRRSIEEAFASFGVQGETFFSELKAGKLDVSGAADVGGALSVGGDITLADDGDIHFGPSNSSNLRLAADSTNGKIQVLATDGSTLLDLQARALLGFNGAVLGTDPGGAHTLRVGGSAYIEDDVQVGFISRPGWVTSTRVTADTATWTSVLPSGGFVTGLFMIREATNGGSALIYGDVNNSVAVVSSMPGTSTVLVTGAPAATQIGVRLSGTDIQVLAGSSRDGVLIDTTFIASKL